MKTKMHLLITVLIMLNFLSISGQSKLDRELVEKLAKIHKSDQENRNKLISILEENGKDSKEFIDYTKKIKEIDSMNMIQVAIILDNRGWLGEAVIGK